MRARSTALVLLAAAAVLDGCACERLPSTALTDCSQRALVQGAVLTDILFVIDDSISMGAEQAELSANLDPFITALSTSPVANDFRIGVTTTSVTNFDGTPLGRQGCLVAPWLAGGGDPAQLVSDFQAQIASINTSGSNKEQPFRAMELALTTPKLAGCTHNADFLRPGSRLAVVFLTDEDDCSDFETSPAINTTNLTLGNDRCHNDDAGNPGVNYKFTRIQSIDHYASFLKGEIGGEVRDVVLAAIVGVDSVTLAPTCGNTGNSWCCGGTNDTINTCTAGQRTSFDLTIPPTPPNLTGSTLCCGGTGGACGGAGTACTSPCNTAYDKADRFAELLSRFPVNKQVTASVCDPSYATALEQIAGLIISPTVPLSGEPADPALLVVRLRKADETVVGCALGPDYTYAPASASRPATVTFLVGGACELESGDRILIDIACAG